MSTQPRNILTDLDETLQAMAAVEDRVGDGWLQLQKQKIGEVQEFLGRNPDLVPERGSGRDDAQGGVAVRRGVGQAGLALTVPGWGSRPTRGHNLERGY